MAIIANLDIVIGAQTAKSEKQLKTLTGSISSLRANVLNLGTAFATFLGARAAINATFDFADKIADMADFAAGIGETYNNLNALKLQADLSGSSLDEMTAAVARSETAFSKWVTGAAELPEAVQRMNINFAELQRLSPVERMFALADAINALPTPAQQAAAASAIFGKSWAQVAAVLNEGSEGFNKARDRIAELGGALSATQVEQFKALGDRFVELKAAIAGIVAGPALRFTTFLTKTIEFAGRVTAGIQAMSGSFGAGAAKVAAFAATFTTIILVAPRLIATFAAIVKAIKSIVVASITLQAAGGPAGLARALATAAGVAAAAVVSLAAVETAFANVDAQIKAAAESSAKVAAASAQAGDDMGAAADQAEALAEAQKKSAEAAQQLRDQMLSRGQQLAESLRTPLEQFRAELSELQNLASFGAIDPETARRAVKAGLERLRGELRTNPITLNLSSAAIGSTEAATTLLARKMDNNAALARKMFDAQQEGNAALDRIDRTLVEINRKNVGLQVVKNQF